MARSLGAGICTENGHVQTCGRPVLLSSDQQVVVRRLQLCPEVLDRLVASDGMSSKIVLGLYECVCDRIPRHVFPLDPYLALSWSGVAYRVYERPCASDSFRNLPNEAEAGASVRRSLRTDQLAMSKLQEFWRSRGVSP